MNNKGNLDYISLTQAAKISGYASGYLNYLARTEKLKAVKFGRNWVTTKEWLDEYIKKYSFQEQIQEQSQQSLAQEIITIKEAEPQKKEINFLKQPRIVYPAKFLSKKLIGALAVVFILIGLNSWRHSPIL